MALTCNIDARGKFARLIFGIIMIALGTLMVMLWALAGGGWLAWAFSGALLAGGAFCVFEARSGWCVMRAMGFRTPM